VKARALNELGAIRKALLDARRAQAEAVQRERERLAREQRERDLFALTVGTVVRLRAAVTAPPPKRPPAVARQRERDEAAVMLEGDLRRIRRRVLARHR
jgi:hypothetical protein